VNRILWKPAKPLWFNNNNNNNNNNNKVGLIKYIKQGKGNDDDDKNNNIIKVRGQSYAPAAPAKYCWYSFLLEAGSTTGP